MAVIRAARPSFRGQYDKVAFVVHATFLSSGYLLTAAGQRAFSDSAHSSSSTGKFPSIYAKFSEFRSSSRNFVSLKIPFSVSDEVGMDGWNEVDGEYAFVYANPEKGNKKVLVKCLVMNDVLLVDALADGCSEPLHLEIK